MSSTPLISVCIPTFNGEGYIRECVTSVLSQSEQDFEILIMDNCSTDYTFDICKKFKDPRIRVLRNSHNVGSIENFNRCIQNASGELLLLLPCDDLLEEDCLNLLSQGFLNYPSVGIAFGSTLRIDEQGRKIGTAFIAQHEGLLNREKAVRMVAERFNPIQHPMVRTKVFAGVGGFEKSFGCFCDIHMWLKILFDNWSTYVVNKPLTAIRCHKNQGQSLFRQNTKDNLKNLSGHYGEPLSPTFYKKNHFNLLFFRFVQFFNRNIQTSACHELEEVMVTHLVRSHLSNIWSSIRYFNLSSFFAEIALAMKLMKAYGPSLILHLYFSQTTSLFKKALA